MAKLIKEIFIKEKELYGAPRIKICLENEYQIKVSEHFIWRYMNLLNIKSKVRQKKKYRPKEIKIKRAYEIPNIPQRQWNKFLKNELWVTDVTYLPYSEHKFAFLSILKDCYSGFITGYAISKSNNLRIYQDTIYRSLKFKDPNQRLVIHSDNGFQYTSLWAKAFAEANNIQISLSNSGNSLDNAKCETFFAQLKTEFLHNFKAKNYEEIKLKVEKYLQYYNFERIQTKTKTTPWMTWSCS